MNKSCFVIRSQDIADNACTAVLQHWQRMADAGKPLSVTIQRTTRSIEQNARHWAILTAFCKTTELGKRFSPETIHEHLKREFLGVTCLPNGLPMAVSSAGLSVDQFCDFNAQCEVWMIDHGANPDIF